MGTRTISLCLIVGNEAPLITRLLDSLKGCFDELCLVSAIGSQPADATEELVDIWCQENGRRFGFDDYWNAGTETLDDEPLDPNNPATWPHVDDFAAARNLSFSLATGDWLMWADADDIIAPEGPAIIRAAVADAALHGLDFIAVPYDVGGGRIVPRTRLIKRGMGLWLQAVHEDLWIDPARKAQKGIVAQVFWRHDTTCKDRTGNGPRNLRILKYATRSNWHNEFALHEELMGQGQLVEARAKGMALINAKAPDDECAFTLRMNMAKMADQFPEKLTWLLEAMKIMPNRRELYAMLAVIHLEAQNPAKALHYCRCMLAIPLPPVEARPRVFEMSLYAWLDAHIHAMVLRAAELANLPESQGGIARAEIIMRNLFADSGGHITLLFPVNGRLHQARMAKNAWLNQASNPAGIQVLFVSNAKSERERSFLEAEGESVFHAGDAESIAAGLEAATREAWGATVLTVTGDMVPVPGWDLGYEKEGK